MNSQLAKEIADRIRAIMDDYPDLIFGMIVYDENHTAASSNYCLRCIGKTLAQFLDENDIKHDSEYNSPEDIPNLNRDTKH